MGNRKKLHRLWLAFRQSAAKRSQQKFSISINGSTWLLRWKRRKWTLNETRYRFFFAHKTGEKHWFRLFFRLLSLFIAKLTIRFDCFWLSMIHCSPFVSRFYQPMKFSNWHDKIFSTIIPDGRLDREGISQIISFCSVQEAPRIASTIFCDHVFRAFDVDGNGYVEFGEFLLGFAICSRGDLRSRLDYAFECYDLDSNGYITEGKARRTVFRRSDRLMLVYLFRWNRTGSARHVHSAGHQTRSRLSSRCRCQRFDAEVRFQ